MASGNYAAATDVAARLPYRTIGSGTSPSTTHVETWIAEGEALLDGALNAADIGTPITNTNGVKQLRSWTCDYAEARVRMAYAAAGGDGSNDDGRDLLIQFNMRVQDIMANPTLYGSMLSGGGAADDSRRLRGHVLDNADSKTIADGDFTPTFTRDEVF